MSGPFEIAPGSVVHVDPPTVPAREMAPPAPATVVVLPVAGPAGPPGPAGDDSVAVQELIDGAVDAHVGSTMPHPVYDDLPALSLLFENGLV